MKKQDPESNRPEPVDNATTQPFAACCERSPLVHAVIGLILLLALGLGYALPYQPPKLVKHDSPEYVRNAPPAELAEAQTERTRIDQLNKDARKKFTEDLKVWNESGEKSRRKLIAFGRNTSKIIAVLWFACCLIACGRRPLMEFIPKHFGKDLAIVILPVILLGVLFALATLLTKWIPESGWPMPGALDLRNQSLWTALGQFFVHLTHPACEAIITLKEYCFANWFVAGILIVTTAILGWQRIQKQSAKVS